MSDASENPPATKRRRVPRWLRIVGWIGIWIVTLLALAVVVENWLGARAWQAYVAEARAAGERLEPEAIVPPPIPDEENFAAIALFKPLFDYERAAPSRGEFLGEAVWRDPAGKERLDKLKPFGNTELKAAGDWRRGEFVDVAAWEKQLRGKDAPAAMQSAAPGTELLLALAKFDPEMNALRAAATQPRARFPIRYEDHISAALPHLGVLRTFTRIAQVRALAELSLGDVEAAHRDLLLGLRLADAISEEPLLLSQLVQVSQIELLMPPLWEGLVRHQWNDAQLAAIDAALARCDFVAGFQRAIRGERSLFAVQAMDAIKARPQHLISLVNLAGGSDTSAGARVLGALLPAGWIDYNKAYLGHYYGRLLKTADPKTHRFLPEATVQLEEEFKRVIAARRTNPHKLLAALVFPAVVTAQERSAATQAIVDLARCAIAIERHRLKHGALPATLDALAPDFLNAPRDVVSGEPLHYRRGPGETFVLYSVGWNGRDDGGEYTDKSKPGTARHFGDWPWPQPMAKFAAPE